MTSELQTNTLDSLNMARKFYQAFADHLTDAQRHAAGTFVPYEAWSAKDVIGHLSASDSAMLERLEVTGRGEAFTPHPDFNQRNAENYEKRHDWTWEQIWQENLDVFNRLEAFINGASDELLQGLDGRPPVWVQLQNAALLHGGAHFSDYWLAQQQFERSEAVYTRMIEIIDTTRGSAENGTALYNKACLYAKTGRKEQALPLLAEALTKVPNLREFSKEDADFALLHNDPDFLKIVNEAQPA
jgi:tetratricopeptide (TPR) repeat protein